MRNGFFLEREGKGAFSPASLEKQGERESPDPKMVYLSTFGPTTLSFLKLCQESDTPRRGGDTPAEPSSC